MNENIIKITRVVLVKVKADITVLVTKYAINEHTKKYNSLPIKCLISITSNFIEITYIPETKRNAYTNVVDNANPFCSISSTNIKLRIHLIKNAIIEITNINKYLFILYNIFTIK